MDFDLGDVGEFINDNPQIPIAAGLVAGQAVRRNMQRARQDAAAIKQGLDAIQRQNDEARRLALEKERRERSLADNRDFLFQLSLSLDRILAQGYSLAGYFEIEDLAHDLSTRNLTTASFADYRDKEVFADVERKVTEAKEIFARQVDSETKDRITDVVRWEYLAIKVRHFADFARELRDNDKAHESAEAKLGEVLSRKVPSLAEFVRRPGFLIPVILCPLLVVALVPPLWLFLAGNKDGASGTAVFPVVLLSFIPLFYAGLTTLDFIADKKRQTMDIAEESSQLKSEISALRQKRAEIDRHVSASKASVLNIRGIDPDTLSFAASLGITQEQRGKLIEDCEEYICNLLGLLGVSSSALPTIRRLRDLHPA